MSDKSMVNKKSGINLIFVFLLLVMLSSCSQYQKLLKSEDVMLKKDKAIEYYEDEEYKKALGLLTDIIPAFRGTSFAEELNYYYAKTHYQLGDYIMASHYFKSFTQGFPRSEYNEEFYFLSAYSKYLLSPRASLDQTPTREAISELQLFINKYPDSPKVAEANELIDELRLKLEEKSYDSAMLYFNLGDFNAAVTAFRSLIRGFPDTEYREEALYYIVKSHYNYAENSITIRQLERYENVTDAYEELVKRFPETEYLEEATEMYNRSLRQIDILDDMAINDKSDNE